MLKQHRFLIPAIILLLILFAAVSGWWLSMPRGDELPASVHIVPSSQEESGILPDTSFNLTTNFAIKEDYLRSILSIEPAINYSLSGNRKNWNIKPVIPLKENTVYTIKVKNSSGLAVQSFAFQTRTDLLVSDIFPADQSSYVDINTGIEFRFNRPGVDLSTGFEILPNVSGHFETLEYSCRFIPDKPLENNSIYRVTLKNIKSSDGASLKEPYTFSFETAEKEGEESWDDLSVPSFAVSFLPGDEMRVALNGGEKQSTQNYTMTLHKYPGINAYINVLRERDTYYQEQYGVKENYRAITTGLDEIMKVDGQLMSINRSLYVPLPEDLSEGYYIFTLSSKDSTIENPQFVQQMIQVVNLSVYTQSTSGKVLFWLGDPVGSVPAVSSSIELEMKDGKKLSGITDEKGLVTLETGENTQAYATIVRDGTPVWFANIPLSAQSEKSPSLSRGYYAALYTDREIFLPGDSIHFWGVVKPRADQPLPTTVWVNLSTKWPDSTLSGMEVQVDRDGTFTGILKPDSLQSGAYSLSIGNGVDGVYLERYLEISEYTKPAYQIALSTDKDFYYMSETAKFFVSAQYYDGTPAAGVKLIAECYNTRLTDYPIILDKNGKAVFTGLLDPSTIQPGDGNVASWEPQSAGWSVRSADAQAVNLSQWDSFMVLPSKIAAQAEYQGTGKLSIDVAVLDDTKLLDTMEVYLPGQTEFDRLHGIPADIPVSLIVHKTTYQQIQTGTTYDPVNKKSIPVYDTKSLETIDKVIPVSTVSGKAIVDKLPIEESQEAMYWYEIRFAGGVYGDVCTNIYPFTPYREHGQKRYTFFREDGLQKSIPGETLQLSVYENGEKPEKSGIVLYTLVQDELLLKDTFSGGTAELKMENKYFPNVLVAGAYFDGRIIHPIQRASIVGDYTQKVLNVKASTDKPEYIPGEKMQVTLSVTDANGQPVEGRAVIGVVDEAIFDLNSQLVDFAGQLYQEIYYPDIVVSTSQDSFDGGMAVKPNTGGFAEMGMDNGAVMSGGSAVVRSVFADTAAFQSVDVKDGKATVELTLPDNITSWRVTAAAVTRDLEAGDTLTNATATMPFYLRPIVSDTYLTGDDISVSALAVGTDLSGGEVQYEATLCKIGNTSQNKTITVPAGERAVFNFGKQFAGAYRVKFTADYNGKKDAIELPLTVADIGLLAPIVETMDLAMLSTVQSARFPVQVTVYDEDTKPLFTTLSWLTARGGERTEIIAASSRAMEIYQEHQPAEDREPIIRDNRLSQIQEDGGIAPLTNASGDATLTAKMLMTAPELVRVDKATQFLKEVLKNPSSTPDDRIMAYVGLAAAKEPILLDLERLYKQEGANMKTYLKLYVGAAFARMGNYDLAKEIKNSVRVIRSGDQCHIDDENITQSTAAALLLSTEILSEDAAGLANYLMSGNAVSGKEGTLWNLELLSYAKACEKHGGTSEFTYEADGKVQTVTLKDGTATLSLDSEILSNGKFRSLSGKLYAAARVLRPMQGTANGNFATVTKTYEPLEELTPGGQVKVTIHVKFNENAPYGLYELSDSIPSGLRWLDGEQLISPQDGSMWPYLSQDGQRIYGAIYRGKPDSDEVVPVEMKSMEASQNTNIPEQSTQTNELVFTYSLSAALPGSFITESVWITQGALIVKSDRGLITVSQ